MEKNYLFRLTKKLLLITFAFFICFSFELRAFDEDEEFDEEELLSCPSRYAFPTTCSDHFSNAIDSIYIWNESDSNEITNLFTDYLFLIPKLYASDCFSCVGCGGMGFNLYNGFDNPTTLSERESKEQLSQCHRRNLLVEKFHTYGDSNHCSDLCWNGAYFRRWNQKYIHFFKHFLEYGSQNSECECFWPECCTKASHINTRAYTLLKNLADEGCISVDFSSFWKANEVRFEYDEYRKPPLRKIYDEYNPNSHGMASSLVTYTFFYSQYHQMLISIASHIDQKQFYENTDAIDRIYSVLEMIKSDFYNLYNQCLREHEHPKIYYERGLLNMHSGKYDKALTDISHLMHIAQNEPSKFNITSEMYEQEGCIYSELGLYDLALKSLNKAIEHDPNNRGAYFKRAECYFETGNLELSLDDFIKSNASAIRKSIEPSWGIRESVLNGLAEGAKDGAVEFVPSLCNSIYGLGNALWIFAEHPIESTNNFIHACNEISKLTKQMLQGLDLKDLDTYPPELKKLFDNFNKMSECEKTHLVAYTIGKYGIDVFAGSAALKSIGTFKKLKNANSACNLEAMTVSSANKEFIVTASALHKSKRESFFNNVKIHVDRQNKHVVGAHNYQPHKSIFQHDNPQYLLSNFAGKGTRVSGEIGQAGYKEVVDFKTPIGIWKDKYGLEKSTTKGTIHYSKDGAHIVPAHPETKL